MKFAKRLIGGALILAVAAALAGCSRGPGPAASYEKIQKRLIGLTSYRADGQVTYKSNKNSHTYDISQAANMSGQYRIEVTGPEKVAGNITICDGQNIAQINERIQGKIILGAKDTPERVEILLTSFIKNYVQSQEAKVAPGNADSAVCTVLEANVPGGNPYMASEKLWVDNATLNPVKLVIYDPSGAERVIVTYADFKHNAELDPSLFDIK